MSAAEYLSVLVSIVVGLGISHILSGVGNLLVDRRRVRFYWPWGIAVLMVFLAYVQFWWGTFTVGAAVSRNFFGFLLFLLSPITLFLGSVMLLPDFEEEGPIDLKAHFFANYRWYFGFVGILPLLNFIRSITVSGDPLYIPQRPYEAVFFLMFASGALVGREWWQKVIAVASLVLFVVFILMASLTPT